MKPRRTKGVLDTVAAGPRWGQSPGGQEWAFGYGHFVPGGPTGSGRRMDTPGKGGAVNRPGLWACRIWREGRGVGGGAGGPAGGRGNAACSLRPPPPLPTAHPTTIVHQRRRGRLLSAPRFKLKRGTQGPSRLVLHAVICDLLGLRGRSQARGLERPAEGSRNAARPCTVRCGCVTDPGSVFPKRPRPELSRSLHRWQVPKVGDRRLLVGGARGVPSRRPEFKPGPGTKGKGGWA